MYKYILQSVEGIQLFGISAFLIFFATFLVVVYRAVRSSKTEMDHAAHLPLED